MYNMMIAKKEKKKKREDEWIRGNTCIFQTKIFLNKINVKKKFTCIICKTSFISIIFMNFYYTNENS